MSFSTLVAIYMDDCKTWLKPTTYAGKVFLIYTKMIRTTNWAGHKSIRVHDLRHSHCFDAD